MLSGDTILAERQGGSSLVAWLALAAVAAGAIVLLLVLGVGVVETAYESVGKLALPLYGLCVMTLAGAMLSGLRSRRSGALPWPAGRYLLPLGYVDARAPLVTIVSAADIERVDTLVGPAGPTGMSSIKIIVRFANAASETFHIFGTARNVPEEELTQLARVREELRAARESGDEEVLERLELLPRSPSTTTSVARKPDPLVYRRPWLTGAIASVAGAGLAFALILPWLSVRSASADNRILHWRKVEAVFPFDWVSDRAREGIHAEYLAAAAAARASLTPTAAEAIVRVLDELERNGLAGMYFDVVAPKQVQLEAANQWLERQAAQLPDATIAPVELHYTTGTPAGEPELLRIVDAALTEVISSEVMRLSTNFDDARAPRFVVAYDIEPVSVFTAGGNRLFAGLRCTFRVSILLDGEDPIALGDPIVVDPPASFEVVRLSFEGESIDAIGESGMSIEYAMVYTRAIAHAADAAGPKIREQLLAATTP